MRKLLISILLASAAASPALADRPDHTDRDQARAERQQAKEQARTERAVQVQRSQINGAQGHIGTQPLVARQLVQPNPGPDPRQVQAFRGGRGGNNDPPTASATGAASGASRWSNSASRWFRTAAIAWTTDRCGVSTVRCPGSCARAFR